MEREVTLRIRAQDSFSSVMSQYQSQLNQAATNTRNLGASNREATSGITQLAGAVRLAMGAFVAFQALNFVGDIVELGQKVRSTEAAFSSLASTFGGASDLITRLRTETRNAVSDLDLMSSANKIMSLNLVENADQMAMLIANTTKLSSVTGLDLEQSLGQVALTLANMSKMRLDQLGVSVEFVTQRSKELRDVGLSAQDAFRQAFLEGQADAVSRLGDAAEMAFTPMDKLATRWQNFLQSASENVAMGAQGILGFLDAIIQRAEDLHFSMSKLDAMETGLDYYGGMKGGKGGFLTEEATARQGAAGTFGETVRRREELRELAAIEADIQARREAIYGTSGYGAGAEIAQARRYMQQFPLAERARALGTRAGPEVNAPDLAEMAANDTIRLERAHQMQERIEAIRAAHEGIIAAQDAQQARMDRAVNQASDLAIEAERARAAFADMGLGEMFGVGGGGRQGEIGDQLIAAMQAAGKSPEEIEAARRRLDLASGRETKGSLGFEQVVAPSLAGLNPDEMARAAANFDAFLTAFGAAGGNAANLTPQQMMRGMGISPGTGAGGQAFTITPGMTASEIAAQLGVTPEQVLAAAGASSAYTLQPGTYTMGEGAQIKTGFDATEAEAVATAMAEAQTSSAEIGPNLDTLSQPIEDARDKAEELQSQLEALGKRVFGIPLRFDIAVNDPAFLNLIRAAVGMVVADNGGVVPGTDPRAGNAPSGSGPS